jgi:hypothetical protein
MYSRVDDESHDVLVSKFVLSDELVNVANNLYGDDTDKLFPEWFPDHRTLICCHIELEDL